jgi:hypothetical protein
MSTGEPALHGGFGWIRKALLCCPRCGEQEDADPTSSFGEAKSGGASPTTTVDQTGRLRWTSSYGRNGEGAVLPPRGDARNIDRESHSAQGDETELTTPNVSANAKAGERARRQNQAVFT